MPAKFQPDVVRELDAGLHGAIVQKVFSPTEKDVWLELRQPGRSTLLCISVEGLSVADERPTSPATASGFQQRLRKLLTGKRLDAVAPDALCFAAGRLSVEGGRVVLLPAVVVDPREPAALAELPLARAAHRHTEDGGAAKRLEQHLKKLKRTRAKIAAEADRGPLAERMRKDGELLARNVQAIKRGAKSVRLTEYSADGELQRDVELDPKRSPKEQVEWLFHQSKRLSRGVDIARQRLEKVDREIASAQLPDPRDAARPKGPEAPSLPYREYKTAAGQRIWVGKGAAHNDALTFRHARPHHLWLHARGVTGAHVVVPLDKKQVLDQETLLDAAHLAFHHSDLKGERQGEVSYTHVRHVRKAGAPGAVSYTRETTFWLRFDPARLERLESGLRASAFGLGDR